MSSFGVLIDEMAHASHCCASPYGQAVRSAKEQVEAELIRESMQRHSGNKKKVAQEIGISRSYHYKKLGALNAA